MTSRAFGRCRLIVVTLVGGLLAAACGGDGGAGGDHTGEGKTFQIGFVGQRETDAKPQHGDTLTFAAYSEATSLDPADTIASGTTGGTALAAVYGVLMRYGPESGKYEPRLAKSLRHSDDYRTWTLSLRDGVTFSDGTVLDAEAVVWSISRYVEQGGSQAALWSGNVASMEATGPSTVVFELERSWPGFVYMLATGPGMIVAPSSVEGEEFTPVGAGPFTLARYAPNEELVLKARKDYWGGQPHLNRLRFVWLKEAQASLDALNTGGVQAAFLLGPEVAVEAREAGYAGFMNLLNLGKIVLINHRDGHPGSNARVRKAIAYAINPEIIDQRVSSGKGLPSKAMFPEFSRWHTSAEPLPYDPAKAKKLLQAAKADGYDGKISYLTLQTTAGRATALTIKALLEKVGFTVTIDYARSVSDQIRRVLVEHSYDLSVWGSNTPEAAPFPELYSSFHSNSDTRATGYSNAKMDRLIEQLQQAATTKAKRQVMARIQRQWSKTVPVVPYGAQVEFVAWQDSVHGIVPTVDTMVLFGDAWIASS